MPNYNMLLQRQPGFVQGFERAQEGQYRNKLLGLQERQIGQADQRLAMDERRLGQQDRQLEAAELERKGEQAARMAYMGLQNPDSAPQLLQRMVAEDYLTPEEAQSAPPEQIFKMTLARHMQLRDQIAMNKGQEGFTLGENQTRFDADGNRIAKGPPKPAPGPQSTIGKLRADLKSRAITEDDFNAAIAEKTSDGEFERLLKSVPPAQRQALLEARLAKLATAQGWQVETSPDGTVRITQGPADKMPTGNKQDEIRGDMQSVSRAREAIASVRKAIESDQGRAGLAGMLARKLQSGAFALSDVAEALPGVGAALKETVDKYAGEMVEFDEALAQFPVAERALAYALAKARKPTGRLNAQDVELAMQDVTLQGLTSVRDVEARLKQIDSEFAKAEQDYAKRLGQDATPKRIESDADYDALPSGAEFIDPEGKRRRKP
jgi:hypothetical protein